jgi:hypothetical protein
VITLTAAQVETDAAEAGLIVSVHSTTDRTREVAVLEPDGLVWPVAPDYPKMPDLVAWPLAEGYGVEARTERGAEFLERCGG